MWLAIVSVVVIGVIDIGIDKGGTQELDMSRGPKMWREVQAGARILAYDAIERSRLWL